MAGWPGHGLQVFQGSTARDSPAGLHVELVVASCKTNVPGGIYPDLPRSGIRARPIKFLVLILSVPATLRIAPPHSPFHSYEEYVWGDDNVQWLRSMNPYLGGTSRIVALRG
jgi:hypothetical protein